MNMVYAWQKLNQWCWAASLEMVFRYHGMAIDQKEIVLQNYGALINLPASPQQLFANLNRVWRTSNGEFEVRSDFFSCTPDLAAHDLNAEFPLILGTMGHATVLTAMTYLRNPFNGSGQPQQLTVRDPWPASPGRRILSGYEMAGINNGLALRVRVDR